MYSQNDEERYILDYFGETVGRFYDIGAWTGKELSNTRALLERGWTGVMVEPEPRSFTGLMDNTLEFGDRVKLVNAAVSTTPDMMPFYACKGDAVSTLNTAHRDLWSEAIGGYRQYFVKPLTPAELFGAFGEAEFINLDVEGGNWELFQALPLASLTLRLVCVEYERRDVDVLALAAKHGFHQLHRTSENLLLAR